MTAGEARGADRPAGAAPFFDGRGRRSRLAPMARRMLPVGIQSLREIRRLDCCYVDKTPYLTRLADEGARYFLPRPRRFGKSLLLDTLKELFEGDRELFRGLAAAGGWDWPASHPVLRISFGSGDSSSRATPRPRPAPAI